MVAAIGAVIAAATLLRLRFLHLPLNTDEAGFAEVARLWSRGLPLYGQQAWVDRPQGLLLAYRLVAATGWDPMARVLAMAAAAVTAAAVAGAAWALAGRRAALIAAVLFAVLSPAPHLEGFTGNGELLGTAFASSAVAVAAWWWARGGLDRRLLVVAGALAAIAPLMKQSAVDGVVAVVALVLVSSPAPRRRGRDLVAVGAGVALPVVAALAHAATIGFGAWWFAVAGHRTQTQSLLHGSGALHWEEFRASLGPFWRDLGVLVPLAALGTLAAYLDRRLTLPLAWLLAAALGFAVGGLYHPHYWMQLAAPLVLLAAIGLDAVAGVSKALAVGLGVLALAIPLAYAEPVYLAPTNARASLLSSRDDRIVIAGAIGDYVRSVTRPSDRIAVLWDDASVFWHADRPPAFQYMWWRPLSEIRGAAERARATITGPDPPVVVVAEDAAMLDPRGDVRRTLAERYVELTVIGGVPVYGLRAVLPPGGKGE